MAPTKGRHTTEDIQDGSVEWECAKQPPVLCRGDYIGYNRALEFLLRGMQHIVVGGMSVFQLLVAARR